MGDGEPDARAQFRSREPERPFVYMGGTAMSCGQHPSLPKRHRWGHWYEVDFRSKGGSLGWERLCQTCALVSDVEWTKPRGVKRPQP